MEQRTLVISTVLSDGTEAAIAVPRGDGTFVLNAAVIAEDMSDATVGKAVNAAQKRLADMSVADPVTVTKDAGDGGAA